MIMHCGNGAEARGPCVVYADRFVIIPASFPP